MRLRIKGIEGNGNVCYTVTFFYFYPLWYLRATAEKLYCSWGVLRREKQSLLLLFFPSYYTISVARSSASFRAMLPSFFFLHDS